MFFKGNRIGVLLVAGCAMASIGSMAAADVLVTQSSGEAARQYPRGTRLPDSATITIGRGSSVTVLTTTGTRSFRTPGSHRVDGQRVLAGGNLGRGSSSGLARTGVSRGVNNVEQIPQRTVWQVDYDETGSICFLPDHPVSVRRGSAGAPQAITITRKTDGASRTLNFGESEWSKPWPDDFSMSSGSEYSMSYAGAITPADITFLPLSIATGDPVALGEALLGNGCSDQFDAMVAAAGSAPAG